MPRRAKEGQRKPEKATSSFDFHLLKGVSQKVATGFTERRRIKETPTPTPSTEHRARPSRFTTFSEALEKWTVDDTNALMPKLSEQGVRAHFWI